jgi:2-succinyl-5-enolpyruvyl-6-hydroxy-3-cyclohexene-1-carboxylate synthase
LNLKVIVINNGGGNIFHWLNGPKEVGMLESHFEVPFLKDAASPQRW